MFPTKETIEMLRTEYSDGTRVRLMKTSNIIGAILATMIFLRHSPSSRGCTTIARMCRSQLSLCREFRTKPSDTGIYNG